MKTAADLFSGAGGFSLGLARAGFTPVFAVDSDRWACETYSRNLGSHIFNARIEDVIARRNGNTIEWSTRTEKLVTPQIDILVGGPPCQGFSRLNRAAHDGDDRNALWKEYFRLLKSISPRIFVIENVPALLKSQEFRKLVRRAKARGYSVAFDILNAEAFSVPQRRRRAFIMGVTEAIATLPATVGSMSPKNDVRRAFDGLPLEPNNINLHVSRKPTGLSLQRYSAIPVGGNRFDLPDELLSPCWIKKRHGSTDVFGRMSYNKPAPTIRTEFTKPEKGRYLHPEANRPITLREGARLQTFPDDFEFVGSHTQIAKQIGNAVPPNLAEALAKYLLDNYFASDLESTSV